MRTRVTLLYLLTLLLSVCSLQPVQAQAAQDALYIFRNDGKFNAFFFGDIKRIEYSKTDTLGVEQPDYVVQEVYALDTLFRIPISAIDSVAFVTPETQYKADVFRPDKSIADYIVASDSVVWIRLASNTPAQLIPKKGDKLFIKEPSKYIPNGFVGLVTDVTEGGDGYTVTTGDLEITDIFDRLVVKAAAATPGPSSSVRTRGLFDGDEMAYTPEEPIEVVNESDVIPLAGSYAIGKLGPVEFTGDVSGKVEYSLKEYMEIRAFLYVDTWGQQFQYDQWTRILSDLSVAANVSGAITGSLNIPAKGFSKKLSNFFNAKIEAGLTIGASFTALDLEYKRFVNGETNSQLVYNERMIGLPPSYKSNSHLTRDSTWCKLSSDGKWTLNTGAYAEVDLGVMYPFKKSPEEKGGGIELRLRGELGGRLTYDVPKLGLSATTIAEPFSTIDCYGMLNSLGNVSLGGYGKLSLSGQLGKWKGALEPDVDLLKTEMLGIVPNFTGIKAEQDKEEPIRPYRIRMSSTATKDIVFSRHIGFAIYDEDDKFVADSLCNLYFREKWYAQDVKDGKNGCVFELDPGKGKEKTYHAYPTVEYLNNRLLAKDMKYEFTLDAARIDIEKRNIFASWEEGYWSDNEMMVIPNMANMQVKAEAKWLKDASWLAHHNQLAIGWEELPEGTKERRGVYRLTGLSKDGKDTLTVDSIVVVQYRPYIELTPDVLEFDVKGGTQTVTIGKTNITDLKLSTTEKYLQAKFDGNTIKVTMTENTDTEERTGRVYIEGKQPDGKDYKDYIRVSQLGTGGGGQGSGAFGIMTLNQSTYFGLTCNNYDEYKELEMDKEVKAGEGILIDGDPGDRATVTMVDENTLHLECKEVKEFADEDEPELIYRYNRTFSADIHRIIDDDGQRHLSVRNIHYNSVETQTYKGNSYEQRCEYRIDNPSGFFVLALPYRNVEYDKDADGNPLYFHQNNELYFNGDREHWGLDFTEVNYTEEYKLNGGNDVYKYTYSPSNKPDDSFNLHIVFNDDSLWGQWVGDGITQQARTRANSEIPKGSVSQPERIKPVRKLPIR